MSSHTYRRLLLIAILPALGVGVLFEVFLGHRHDYTGHFAAGYGASFAAAMFWLRLLAPERFCDQALRWLVPLCLLCIAGGTLTEATIFRLAKFDEIDFFNQSLGAVLAMICALGYVRHDKPPVRYFDYGLIAGIGFLGAGGCYAVA